MIRKVKNGWEVLSEKGRSFGIYKTRLEAERRLKQIEYFKHRRQSS